MSVSINNLPRNNRPATELFKRIWRVCRTIPKGKVATYRGLAVMISRPRAARVVARAMAANPFAPEVPCHRVIRTDRTLGGYSASGGLKRKIKLLKKEGIHFDLQGKVRPEYIYK